ncbi:hypothetical protein [Streptomyces chromofuscus]|uniref:Uncharacterized protein n=1 Tax=Streptomyces chromofuscus TaxID=42881 RepID=A0A7M2T3H8_STRCW|nr:hypothetical protein [Streptomyces chromofuscus]QOV43210.1 hypothetical protein IPT68_26085 [Streptomyces chromofuscus]GGT32574.1 hypothetical protein GCM10010254_61270 [Streptomyces chromofuscus]
MSGRADCGEPSDTTEVDAAARNEGEAETRTGAGAGTEAAGGAEGDAEEVGDPARPARRARWTAAGTGGLLALAGLAASLLRAADAGPALVPAAYAVGAAVCGGAAVLGSRGRTRRALWLLVGGVTVMAFGDQFD